MKTRTDTPTRRERRKQDRPGELLDAALDLFVEKGFAATRVEEVAARAGVSKGTLFLYFATKEDLFKAVVRHNLSGRFSEWNAEFDAFTGSAAEMLRYCMHAWWQRIGATRVSGITKLVMGEARNFPEIADFYVREVVNPGQALIRRILQRGVDRAEFAIDDIDQAVFAVVAPMMFLIMHRHSLAGCASADLPLDPDRYLDTQARLLLQGMCVRRPQPRSGATTRPRAKAAGRSPRSTA